jgi:hypothetical protein
MLLLIFSNSYGTFIWTGPNPARTVIIEAEPRTIVVV